MDQTNPKKIIALFARRREIGFVFMENGEILRYGVKTIKGKRNGTVFLDRVAKSIQCLLAMMGEGSVVVIERVDSQFRHGELTKVLPDLVSRFVGSGDFLMDIPLSVVKQRLCGSKNATQKKLMESIVRRYPIFEPVVSGVKADKARYWGKPLMAVALAEASSS